jgi:hypothetical protein
MSKPTREFLIEITKRLADEGKLIEAGWVGFKLVAIPPDASEVQIAEMRVAFFAGAQNLFGSIMTMLDPGSEPTESDLKKIDLIHQELEQFLVEFKARHNLPGGAEKKQ